MLGLRRWRCDGCGRRRWRFIERPMPKIETIVVPAIGEVPEGKYRAVRLYCRRCTEVRKERR